MARLDPDTGALPPEQVSALLTDRTRLVAVTAASNLTGACPDIPAIAAAARRVDALTVVDGVHHCPHVPVDVTALGADLYITSAHKWAGPHLGAVVAADAAVLARIDPERPAPAPSTGPARFEQGTNPFPALAAVEHWAGLAEAGGDRRARLVATRAAAADHGRVLGERLWRGLGAMAHVQCFGPAADRTPIASFRVAGHEPAAVVEALDRAGVNAWAGYAYAWEAAGALGVRDDGGHVRIAVNHYSQRWEVDRALETIAGRR